MGLREWYAAHRQDERERYYHGRAGMHAFGVVSLALLVQSWWYMGQGRQAEALDVAAILGLGQLVYWGLLLRWRIPREG